jgi:hypothetical protein
MAEQEYTREDLLETIHGLVTQFAYRTQWRGGPAFGTGGLSALEDAFAVLGWGDPYPCPAGRCQHKGCQAWATCGTPTPDGGYKRTCGPHVEAARTGREA